MPDGGHYLWEAHTVRRTVDGYRAPDKIFAVALGCELRHAGRHISSRGLELRGPTAFIPTDAWALIDHLSTAGHLPSAA